MKHQANSIHIAFFLLTGVLVRDDFFDKISVFQSHRSVLCFVELFYVPEWFMSLNLLYSTGGDGRSVETYGQHQLVS